MGEKVTSGPLTGFRVIDASTILAGPLTCQILGDYGADVIKIEHPVRGDNMRGHGPSKDGIPLWWKEVSRNKRTLGLSLSTPAGAAILESLVAKADVLVENFRPGTLERWGLAPESLHTINPGLVILRVTGFGQTGPYSNRPGFGTLAESMSGFAHLTGPADGPPTLPAFGLADSIAGIAGSSAVTMALLDRERNGGQGQVIDLSLLEPILTAVGPGVTVYDQLGIIGTRHGNRSTNNAPRNTYLTSDGHWIAISTSANTIAENVMRLVGHPEVIDEDWFATGSGRAAHGDLLDGYVSSWVGERTRDEVVELFERAGSALAPIYTAKEITEDPHITQTEMITTVEDPDLGPLKMHNVMWRMSRTPGSIRFPGRALGADTQAILTDEVGLSDEQIIDLRSRGVIA